jgi:hypothetical protein
MSSLSKDLARQHWTRRSPQQHRFQSWWLRSISTWSARYVPSLARPGGNLTGVTLRLPELAAKQLELLTDVFPQATRLGILWDQFTASQFEAAEENARTRRLSINSRKLENPPYDFNGAFRTLAADRADMVLVLSSAYFARQRPEVARVAVEFRVPTMFTAGWLMSYGADSAVMRRRGIAYVDRIMKGAKPSDLPIEQPTKFELVINLKTAKALRGAWQNCWPLSVSTVWISYGTASIRARRKSEAVYRVASSPAWRRPPSRCGRLRRTGRACPLRS